MLKKNSGRNRFPAESELGQHICRGVIIPRDVLDFVSEEALGYLINFVSVGLHDGILAFHVPATYCATRSESPQHMRCLIPISLAMRNPCSRASYSAMLFVAVKWTWSTYFSSSPVGDLRVTPAPEP